MSEIAQRDLFMFSAFSKWGGVHNKAYPSVEEQMYRFRVFKENVQKIKAMQDEGRPYQLGLTVFADLTTEEFERMYLNNRFNTEETLGETVYLSTENVPDDIDWRSRGAVTPMKNQGSCGSCWAFAAVGAVEGLHFLKNGKLLDFSEQQLVDCSDEYGNMGCSGGFALWGQQYIADYGVELQTDYPYKAKDQNCDYDEDLVVYQTAGVIEVPKQQPDQLAAALANQPVAVRVKADSSAFQFYKSGVLDSTACGTQPNHAITAVGYDAKPSKPYWIVKNSWGPAWGESGYVRILKESKSGPGICGIYQGPTYPK